MRTAAQVRTIIEHTKPKLLLITHEGHAWERLVFHSARQVNKNIHCIGYTHAPIFERQHAVKRPLGNEYNPDHILTSGPIQKRQLIR